MRPKHQQRRAFETLESRYCFSSSPLTQLIASRAAASLPDEAAHSAVVFTPSAESSETGATATALPTSRQYFFATAPSSQWDWLANTGWYVPADNLLAYAAESDLSGPEAIGDQTLWHIEESVNGKISGNAMVQLSIFPSPSQRTFTGIVTRDGQIRIEFTSSSGTVTTGIGQMRYQDGQWYMQMQMLTGDTLVITHWANMAQTSGNIVPPDATEPPQENLASADYQWIEGTTWAITDKNLFGRKSKSGVFTIDEYENGYFWGIGTSGKKSFNVLGSVTPEGNLLLAVSVAGGTANTRTGLLQQTAYGGMMTLRTYEGKPAVGAAWTIDVSLGINAAIAQLTGSIQQLSQQSSDYHLTKSQVRNLAKDFTREVITWSRANT